MTKKPAATTQRRMTVHIGAPSSMARMPSRTKPNEMQGYQSPATLRHAG